jgi:hypothetical protein
MLTQAKYIDYLLSTPRNYTCPHLAAHLPGVSPDEGTRFLRNSAFSANPLRALVLPLLHDSPEAFLLVDDSVQDKGYSRFIEVAKRQYSGAVHGPVTGIGLVNRVQSSGESGDFLPLDFRRYAPEADGLPKNEHFQAMFAQVVAEDKRLARTVLFDSWYAASANVKQIHRAGWTFFTPLKSNRLVSLSKERGDQGLDTLEPPASGWSRGVEVRLQQVPFAVKRFKLVATSWLPQAGCHKLVATSWLPRRAALKGSLPTTWPPTCAAKWSLKPCRCAGRWRNSTAASSSSPAPKNARAARPAPSATTSRAATWPGCRCASTPLPSAKPFTKPINSPGRRCCANSSKIPLSLEYYPSLRKPY